MGLRRWLVGAAVLWSVLIATSLFSPLGGIPWSLAHGLIWVLGLMGLVGAVRYFRHQDQKRAHIEALLRDSEAKYRMVADFTYDWEYWIDHGRLLYVSPACELITGYRPDEFIADPGLLQGIVHPEDRPAVVEHFGFYSQPIDEASANFDFRIITRQGETRWMSHRCLPVFEEGSYRGRRVSNRDITQRKQTEADLQRTTGLLKAVRRVQALYLSEADSQQVFKELLNVLVSITDSEFGFLDEVLRDEKGTYKLSPALSDISWNESSRQLYANLVARNLEFRNLNNLADAPVTTGKRVIANDALHDPRSGGLPPDHPPLYNYLGMPIYFGSELIGVAGVANRPGGYDDELADWLEPFLSTCAGILHAMHLEQGRRQTEQAFRNSTDSMTAILNALPESAFLMDRDGTILGVNETMTRRLGHPVSAMLGANAYALILSDLASSRRQQIEAMFETAEPIQFEDMREGQLIDNSIYPVVDERGKVSRVVVFSVDITERRQVEEALWMANLYNRNLLEASLDSLMVIDPDERFSDVNAATEQVTGYPREELVGADFSAYFTDPERARAGCQQTFAQGEVHDYELAIRHREGRVTPVLYNAAVCRDESGEIIGVFAAARDITDRKQMTDLIQARLRLIQFAATHSLEELLQATLDEAGILTDSPIGFYHFLEADQQTLHLQAWSTQTVQLFCKAVGKSRHYDLEEAGVWADCVRERRPIIHNDYVALPQRRDLPPGHATVIRELVIPVFRGERIVAVLGVGNRPYDYGEQDIDTVATLADLAWDIAERKQAEEALRQSEARYRRIVETANEGIWAMDEDYLTTFINPRMAALLGYTMDEILGQPVTAFLFEADLADHREKMRIRQQGGDARYERRFRRKDGSELWTLVSAVALSDDHLRFGGSFAMFTDITLLKEQQQRLEQMAHYDALTQLPNRVLLADRLRIALALARREDRLLAICYLDLDGFKPINDTLGHEVGDRLLAAVAGRLQQCLREGDTVARMGGDEFVLLLGGLSDVAEGERALHRLLAAIAEPYALGDGLLPVSISASVGVTLFPLDHTEPDILLRHADQAMYQAKHTGRNRYCRFSERPELAMSD
ncbi:MAG: PAS domain S-box protein [Candidatus Contendobacter sp.]|nr:PAS domain S-box protein [Gammaproteobacteria bacterium]MCC8994396.1 PAS domain S-box protein [Candidatus Contendobacter sp.]